MIKNNTVSKKANANFNHLNTFKITREVIITYLTVSDNLPEIV